ncbi:DUF488 domain-containing protein [Bacillota bacterium]
MIKNQLKTVYTVGHSTISVEEFLSVVREYGINCIVDVRSTPYSKFAPQFNMEKLQYFLKQSSIQYIFMGREFGARREEEDLYDIKGELNFEKAAESKAFADGIDRIEKGIQKGYIIAFMCTEKDPMDCHRSIMVGRKFSELGYNVINILHDGTSVSQKELEKRLLNKYFPQRDQICIFSLPEQINEDELDLVCQAYHNRNSEIAYKIDNREANNESLYNRVYEKNG